MASIPKDPKDILPEIIHDFQRVFGNDLLSMSLYGSAASGEYLPGKSDINILVVLAESSIDALDQAFDVIAKWRKRRVATPLFLTEAYIQTSLDVFPIEYLNLRNNYALVHGKDVLGGLTFSPRFVRLQCEREVKGKLLLLREAFVETQGKGKQLNRLVAESMQAFVAVFNGLLYLKGMELPQHKRDVIKQACQVYDLDHGLFQRLLDIKEEKVKVSETEMRGLFRTYLRQVAGLWKVVDGLGEDSES